jgi:hypothetical protein
MRQSSEVRSNDKAPRAFGTIASIHEVLIAALADRDILHDDYDLT